jgi:hypothetical protein
MKYQSQSMAAFHMFRNHHVLSASHPHNVSYRILRYGLEH